MILLLGNVRAKVDEALDLDSGLAEVEKQANGHLSFLEIVDALSGVNIVESSHGLELDQHDTLHQDVREEVADDFAVIKNLNGVLLDEGKSRFAELQGHCVLVQLLEIPTSQLVGHLEGAANHLLGDLIQSEFICVHL